MKKKVLLLVLFLMVFLPGCVEKEKQSWETGPISNEEQPFDIAEARVMIEALEAPIIELLGYESIERDRLLGITGQSEIFSAEGSMDIINAFIDHDQLEAEDTEELYLYKDYFVPTVFHEGIEIKKAFVQKTVYKDERFNTEILHVEVGYTGSDELLKNFGRTYLFIKTKDDAWELVGDEGVDYFQGAGYNPTYLPLVK